MDLHADAVDVRAGNGYGDNYISGNATVQLGNNYHLAKDLFEQGTKEQRRQALFNALAFAGSDTKREQLSLTDIGSSSFRWLDNTRLFRWLGSRESLFWVYGKPGSGKSTLMRYLSESKWTRDRLDPVGSPWTVLHFFYDYNFGKDLANQPLGMMKLFLQQLTAKFNTVRKFLQSQEVVEKLNKGNLNDHVDLFCYACEIIEKDSRICVFVDGLDEYEGNPWHLCSVLETLRERTRIKMCLASRPEPEFLEAFRDHPMIAMQHYNTDSITTYIDRRLCQLSATNHGVESRFPADLRAAIATKAQGVILWARLVTDEIVMAIDSTTTTATLFDLLESIPPEVQQLYDRILNKISPDLLPDVALVLHFVFDPTFSASWGCDPQRLFETVTFVKRQRGETKLLGGPLQKAIFILRLQVLVGQILEVIKGEQTIIRPFHMTMATYFRNSAWTLQHLTIANRESFEVMPWYQLCVSVILQVSEDSSLVFNPSLESCLDPTDWDMCDRSHKGKSVDRQAHLQDILSSSQWAEYSLLVELAIEQIYALAPVESSSESLKTLRDKSLSSISGAKMMRYHLLDCETCQKHVSKVDSSFIIRKLGRMENMQSLGLALAAYHGLQEVVEYQLDQDPRATNVMFDICIRSVGGGYDALRPILDLLMRKGCYLDLHHLCAVAPHTNALEGIKLAQAKRPSIPWSRSHDEDCKYSGSSSPIMIHMFLNYHFSMIEDLEPVFAAAGETSDMVLDELGGPFQHLLQLAYTASKNGPYIYDDMCLRKAFEALKLRRTTPFVQGKYGNVLATAETFKSRYEADLRARNPMSWLLVAKWGFFDDFIRDVKKCQRTNKWPRRQVVENVRLPVR